MSMTQFDDVRLMLEIAEKITKARNNSEWIKACQSMMDQLHRKGYRPRTEAAAFSRNPAYDGPMGVFED